jgi:hypothetical protein
MTGSPVRSQGMEPVRERAESTAPEHESAPAPPAARPLGNGRGAALAAVARHASRHAGNRATQAILRAPPRTTADMHAEIYGDSSAAHSAPAPPPEPAYEFSDDPLADGGFGPGDSTIRVKPGPVRADLIRPKFEPPSREWLEESLKKDPLLKELPDWARTKAIDALKDADEMAAEKIIDALPWDGKTKAAALAAIKSVLQLAKGRTFKTPEAPPNPRLPDWTKPIDVPKAPGEQIFMLPPIRF